VLENMKANEEILIQRDEEMNIKLHNSETRLNALKEQAQHKLERWVQMEKNKMMYADAWMK